MNKNNNGQPRRRPTSYNELSRQSYVASQDISTNVAITTDFVPVGGESMTENTGRAGMPELHQPGSNHLVQLSGVSSASNNSNLGIRNAAN